ncbi:MAG: SUMF1/EgtB/PvdO family nonheme iron enzyme [Candidatus Eisenbacteria sp.]|nr:SUMF1/EgtB/PvdO family nonheme iron enzyme [Candidatus Eisenbacteria bacterium]
MFRRYGIIALLILIAAAGATAQDRMLVHHHGGVDEYVVSEVDSITFAIDTTMVYIPSGLVRLGQEGVPGAEPENDFFVEGFWIDVLEVTNGNFQAFMDAGGYSTEEWWNPVGWDWIVEEGLTEPWNWYSNEFHGGGVPGNENFPVLGVSWWEADAYARWAGKRLPTEAEWEKTAKGGCEIWGDPDICDELDTPTWPFGEQITWQQANGLGSGDPYEGNGWTTPIGFYDGEIHMGFETLDSPSVYGLYDVAGNVSEWCSTDRLYDYPYDPNDGREDPPSAFDEGFRVLRGGSWHDYSDNLRCALRGSLCPSQRDQHRGFRCARND